MQFKCPKCGHDTFFTMDRYSDAGEAVEIRCDNYNASTQKLCKWSQLVSIAEVAVFAAQKYIITQAEKKRANKKKK